jgi:hypothetical protein
MVKKERVMEQIITIDFVTALITNSSSTVYSAAGSVDELHDVIDEILTIAESPKVSRDLFKIYRYPDEDRCKYTLEESPEDYEDFVPASSDADWSERQETAYAYITKRVKAETVPESWWTNYDDYEESSYLVCLKDGTETKLGARIFNLFGHEAGYN